MLATRREKKLHRTTAYNCKFWIGDNDPVDWGECTLCLPDPADAENRWQELAQRARTARTDKEGRRR